MWRSRLWLIVMGQDRDVAQAAELPGSDQPGPPAGSCRGPANGTAAWPGRGERRRPVPRAASETMPSATVLGHLATSPAGFACPVPILARQGPDGSPGQGDRPPKFAGSGPENQPRAGQRAATSRARPAADRLIVAAGREQRAMWTPAPMDNAPASASPSRPRGSRGCRAVLAVDLDSHTKLEQLARNRMPRQSRPGR